MRDDWVEVELGKIVELNPKILNKSEIDEELEVQFLPMKLVEEVSNKIHLDETKKFNEVQKKSYTYFAEGDVLFAKVTPCMENGKIAVANGLKNGIGFGSSEFHVLRCSKILLNYFLFFYIVQEQFRRNAQHEMTGAVGLRRVPINHLKHHLFPLPPLPIQRAIVAKIETLFSDLDNGIADLKKAQEQLKVYRQAVLKKAFEGELTKVWREQQTNLPTAEELLEQIKNERQKHYEQQLEEWEKAVKAWEGNGRKGKKPGRPKKLTELSILTINDLNKLAKLPKKWKWIRFNELLYAIRGGTTSVPQDIPTDYPILRSSSIRFNKINFEDIRYIKNQNQLSNEDFVKPHDLLFTRLNGTVDFVGNCVKIKDKFPTNLIYPDRLYCAKLCFIESTDFAALYFLSPTTRKKITDKAKSTAGHKRISLSDITTLAFPLCSLPEQHQIVREIESRLSVCDKVEQNITEALEKSEALRQSILKKAFEGKLLSKEEIEVCKQTSDYEPASELLKKIKMEKK